MFRGRSLTGPPGKKGRGRCGSIFPAAATSSRFYSFSSKKFFCTDDVLTSQGWPSTNDSVYGDTLPYDCSTFKSCEERKLVGNGMHLSQVGMVFLYIMSFLMRKQDALSMVPIYSMDDPTENPEVSDIADTSVYPLD